MKSLDVEQVTVEINAAPNLRSLEEIKIKYLGRKGLLTSRLKEIGELPASERAAAGAEANRIRTVITCALNTKEDSLQSAAETLSPIDVTAPGIEPKLGHHHPVSLVLDEMVDLFWQMGYSVAKGPEVETEWYNFEALNLHQDHPARDMQDTFYLEGGNLPRTHTSSVQIRYMQDNKPPIRIIAPGKVHRNEDEDARHSWIFHQVEGLVVDEGITIGDLKGTLEAMMRGILGDQTKVRLRPNYFPYTEPSVEMDATCVVCRGEGIVDNLTCRMCSGTGWLELGGAGMVHPQVLANVGIDPAVYSGFAFGFGPERIAAIKYGVDDVREFWRPNLKFLEQF